MKVNIFLILLLLIIFTIYNSVIIVYKETGIFKKMNAVLVFIIGVLWVLHFFYCVFIYYKVNKYRGLDGPKGIVGLQGKPGKDGKCKASCGQKVCYALTLKSVNEYLEKYNLPKLKNKLLIQKINKMCHSTNYYNTLLSQNKNRPNEKKLINFIKEKVLIWIELIKKHSKGAEFLNNETAQENYFKNENPFDEIKKYDIYSWGEPYKIKPIVRIQCSKKVKMPNSDKAKLFIKETNNYLEPVFTTDISKDIYGPDDCPYNQLGENFYNEDNRTVCYYYDTNNNVVNTNPVYKKIKFSPFNQQFSFYNVEQIITENNQYFYPIGTIWRGTNEKFREPNSKIIGPEKKTILISGEIQSPSDYTLIWNSSNCENCLQEINNISIWRPVPPANYVSLGDVIVKGFGKPSLDMVKCVPKQYTNNFDYDQYVWSTSGFKKTTYDSGSILNTKKLNQLYIWPIGYNNVDEENLNLNIKELFVTGGYNLFRASINKQKPTEKAYILNNEYTSNITPEPELGKNTKLGFGWMGGKPREGKYSIYDYLGITTSAIITNTNTNNSPDGLGKSYYIENVKDNYYGIKAYNDSSNSFNNYITSSENGLIKLPSLSKNNANQLWLLELLRDDNNKLQKSDGLVLVKLKNKSSNKCFIQEYDNFGIITEKEGELSDGHIFKLQSFNGDIFK